MAAAFGCDNSPPPSPAIAGTGVGNGTSTAPSATPDKADHPEGGLTARSDDPVAMGYAIFTVGGEVTGLSGSVDLRLAGTPAVLHIGADGVFTFPTLLSSGAPYSVSVATQPATQICKVAAATGVVASADVTAVAVRCSAAFTIGGTVTGMSGPGLTLQNGDGAPLPVSVDGAFTFPTRVEGGGTFDVHVASAPAGQECTVTAHGSGTVAAAVTDVRVVCFAPYATCNALHAALPEVTSGVHSIRPAGAVIHAYCDMTRDGGGWTRVVNIQPDSNFQGDRSAAFGDVSHGSELAKLDDALITSMNTVGYFRFECGATFNGFVRNDQNVWSSAKSNALTWSVDPTRSGTFSCPASRDGYVFSTYDGTNGPCGAASTSYVASDGATEGSGCYVEGEGWGRFGNLWVK